MTKKYNVAMVAEPGGGSGLCNPTPCIVINPKFPPTPPPTGEEIATLLEQLATLENTEIDLSTVQDSVTWLLTQDRGADAYDLEEFVGRHIGDDAPITLQRRHLQLLVRCCAEQNDFAGAQNALRLMEELMQYVEQAPTP